MTNMRALLEAQAAGLGTSIASDEQILADLEHRAGGLASSSSGMRDGGSGDGGSRVAAAAAKAAAGLNPARLGAAVRARLEHKLLLREALTLLGDYERALDQGVVL